MNKTQLLADIESKVLKVVATKEEADEVKNTVGVKMYVTHIMEQNGESVSGRNIGWYTIDEGTAQEKAFLRDAVNPKNVARDAVITYLDGLSPTPYIRSTNVVVNEENLSATAQVVKDNGDGTATEKRVFVFKNGAKPIEHVELT